LAGSFRDSTGERWRRLFDQAKFSSSGKMSDSPSSRFHDR
jgi:hypothetical protein